MGSGTDYRVRTDYGVGQSAWSTDQFVALGVTVTLDVIAATAP